jgi:hypothetical protein
MTTPREPNKPGLSTADMAGAGQRPSETTAATDKRPPEPTTTATARQAGDTGSPTTSVREEQTRTPASTATATRDEPTPAATNVKDEQPISRQQVDRAETRGKRAPLFAGTEADQFRTRWGDIQTSFVDEPRRSVEEADGLVAEVMQRLAQVFADERRSLEQQWDRGEQTDTEELRQALQRYRSFFDRLLSM